MGLRNPTHFSTTYSGGFFMKLSAPKTTTWWIAIAAGVLGFLGTLTPIPVVSDYSFWFVFGAFVLLALATYLKDL
jgi:hypothetical protein